MEIKTLSTEKILLMLANATTTYYECSGHHKSDMNERKCKQYKEELQNRGEVIPNDHTLLHTGTFNGEGSY